MYTPVPHLPDVDPGVVCTLYTVQVVTSHRRHSVQAKPPTPKHRTGAGSPGFTSNLRKQVIDHVVT